MLKIGLTGGIGSGKTVVAEIFKVFGIPVFNADVEAKILMEKDAQLVSSIQKMFGAEIYTNGKLNRALLANIVFNDPFKLDQLNALVHPAAIKAADDWMSSQTSKYVVKEAALMFESASAAHLDFIVGVHAPEALRIKRVMDRDNVSRDQVIARMNRQISETIKMKLCNFVVVNDDQQLLIPQVLRLNEKFLDIADDNINLNKYYNFFQ